MQVNRVHLILNKPLLESSSVVNSTAPIEEAAARIKLATMTFFRPNLKFKISETQSYRLVVRKPRRLDKRYADYYNYCFYIIIIILHEKLLI